MSGMMVICRDEASSVILYLVLVKFDIQLVSFSRESSDLYFTLLEEICGKKPSAQCTKLESSCIKLLFYVCREARHYISPSSPTHIPFVYINSLQCN